MNNFAFKLVIVLLAKINAIQSDSPLYCNIAACPSKPHILCLNNDRHHYRVDVITQKHILNTLNRYRIKLALTHHICNLPMLEWSTEFEYIAQAAHKRDLRDYCRSTADYKNIYVFKTEFNATTSNESNSINMSRFGKILEQVFTRYAEQPDANPWIYSAYSNRIGCSYKCNMDMENCSIICLTNGIQLKYFNQSFGYNSECSDTSTMDNNQCIGYRCTTSNHFICTITNQFTNAVPIKMPYTAKNFILNKLHDEQQYATWNNDLEYISERIVGHNLTEHDICNVLDRYNTTFSMEMRGRKRFSEILSNIDNVWMTSQMNIIDKIGCALFNADDIFNIYCLFTKTQMSESYRVELAYDWRIILCGLIIILTTVNVFQIFVLVYLKIYQRRIYGRI